MIKAYPIEKAIENSKKSYIHNLLPEIIKDLNEEIKIRSEDGYYSATLAYKYPSFYSDFKIEQIQEVIKRIYEKAGYIADCEKSPYHKDYTLLFTITWKDNEDD